MTNGWQKFTPAEGLQSKTRYFETLDARGKCSKIEDAIDKWCCLGRKKFLRSTNWASLYVAKLLLWGMWDLYRPPGFLIQSGQDRLNNDDGISLLNFDQYVHKMVSLLFTPTRKLILIRLHFTHFVLNNWITTTCEPFFFV